MPREPGYDPTCPMCSEQGEHSTFHDVYLCVTDGCRVWTYEAAKAGVTPRKPSHGRARVPA